MCKYCDVKYNATVGYNSGDIILWSSHLCIIRDDNYEDGQWYLSDNMGGEIEISTCPICGKKLK